MDTLGKCYGVYAAGNIAAFLMKMYGGIRLSEAQLFDRLMHTLGQVLRMCM